MVLKSYLLESIHAVYKLISWIVRPKDSAIRNVISRREPHWIRTSTLSTSGRVTVSFKYWQLHSTGGHRYSSYRRFLSRTADRYLDRAGRGGGGSSGDDDDGIRCRGCALSFVPRNRSFLRERSRMSVWFYDNVGRLPNRRANMTCTILYSRAPSALRSPVYRFSAPSTAYFVCSLIFANLYIRFPHVVGENVSRACREIWRACAH